MNAEPHREAGDDNTRATIHATTIRDDALGSVTQWGRKAM
jgi:hypothetical protein